MSSRVAESEYARVMATGGAQRTQGLVKLVRVYVDFAPAWASLAEEHWAARRREEALNAARRALAIDPSLHNGFSLDLKMATRPMLAQVAPKAPARAEQPSGSSTPSQGEVQVKVTLANRQMLNTALGLQNIEERLVLLQELEVLAPNDPELLFHLAKEMAVAGRMDDARRTGEHLNRCAPERYVELYAWAEKNLAGARARAASSSASPAVAPSAPGRLPSDDLPTRDRTIPPSVQPVVRDADEEHLFDEAATIDVTLTNVPGSELYDEEVTTRSSIKQGAIIGDADNQTARLHLSELERLVAVSMDPELDN